MIRVGGTNWGAAAPNQVAARTPDHGSGGSGARNARSWTGGRAYGMPRNTIAPRSCEPRSRPEEISVNVSMTGWCAPVAGAAIAGRSAGGFVELARPAPQLRDRPVGR